MSNRAFRTSSIVYGARRVLLFFDWILEKSIIHFFCYFFWTRDRSSWFGWVTSEVKSLKKYPIMCSFISDSCTQTPLSWSKFFIWFLLFLGPLLCNMDHVEKLLCNIWPMLSLYNTVIGPVAIVQNQFRARRRLCDMLLLELALIFSLKRKGWCNKVEISIFLS